MQPLYAPLTITQSPALESAVILVLNSNPDYYFYLECSEQAQNWFWNSLKMKSPQQANPVKLTRNSVVCAPEKIY